MIEVGVREARERFRWLLERVSEGEEVIILRRGKAVARLSPLTGEGDLQALPDLSAFRKAITVKGAPLSSEVTRGREDARY